MDFILSFSMSPTPLDDKLECYRVRAIALSPRSDRQHPGCDGASTILEKPFEAQKQHAYLEARLAWALDRDQKRKKLLDACAEELSVKGYEWSNIQV
ncbi:hypothetical protein ACFVTJ_23035, partial [Agrobacterium sp. NPDC058088]|uniref:hypothetical protein n=1 Tax=Agrobacterium sp. NPDC058088 TaxID=3346335 RepID=UPI0036DC9BA2